MSGTLEPVICIDPATGREIYAPTGEPVDQVLTVVASALPAEDAGGAFPTCAELPVPDGTRWALFAVLLLVVSVGFATRRFASRAP